MTHSKTCGHSNLCWTKKAHPFAQKPHTRYDSRMKKVAVSALLVSVMLGPRGAPFSTGSELNDIVKTNSVAASHAHTNRLAREKSPYLLQHQFNPVDWYPWGQEAFEKARRENKPIFLSIGYSTCHWCHVMERESFENSDVARLLNDYFVSIKVDREERPDVERSI